jgi:hypothetical protein
MGHQTKGKIMLHIEGQLFRLGQILATPGAMDVLGFGSGALARVLEAHAKGQWGEVGEEDAATNEEALQHGARLLSVYNIDGAKVWIITEADRLHTTVLTPDEY